MKNRSKTLRMVQLALLIAVELIFAYTPLGYLKPAGLEITFLMVPVTIGAILLGPVEGAVLGGVFGLTSFSTCFGTSPFGAALLAINPFFAFFVCFVPRLLAGLCGGLIFRASNVGSKGMPRPLSFTVASLAAPLLNTVFFMSALVLCFYQTDYIQNIVTVLGASNPFMFVLLFVGLQGLLEAAVCWLISGVLCRALWPVLHRSETPVSAKPHSADHTPAADAKSGQTQTPGTDEKDAAAEDSKKSDR